MPGGDPMSGRPSRRMARHQARLAREPRGRPTAPSRQRVWRLSGTVALAIVVVAVAVATSSGGGRANAASGGRLSGAAFSAKLFAGIPQRGTVLGRRDAPVRLIEFADLQCPYCDQYAVQALPTLVRDYVRTGKVRMQFENLSFIGPGSVAAGRAAAAAAQQNRLWNFVDLMYLNQGEENSGYVTSTYLQRLLEAVPGLNVPAALSAAVTPAADTALLQANDFASRDGIDETPSFLVGRGAGPLRAFQPASLTAAPFMAAFDALLKGSR
jgi:protein-disulfide isomerase